MIRLPQCPSQAFQESRHGAITNHGNGTRTPGGVLERLGRPANWAVIAAGGRGLQWVPVRRSRASSVTSIAGPGGVSSALRGVGQAGENSF